MAFSPEEAAKVATVIKNNQPDIDDATLAALVKEASELNNDPVKSQAFAAKILPQLNTQLADPYKGAGYTSADSMKQFSPEQMRAALAKQQAAYQQNQPSRAIGSILAGSSGSADVMNKNKSDWEGIDAQNMLQSLGAQEKLQGQATAGLAAAKGVQDMAKVAGEYSGNQIEKQQKLQTSQLTLDQQKRLNDPRSTETIFAKRMMASQIESNPALAKDPELKAVLARPDVTAQMIMGFMDKNVLDAYNKALGIVVKEGEASGSQAVAKEMFGTTKPVIGTPQPTSTTQPYQAGGGRGLQGAEGVNNVGNLRDPKTGKFRNFATPEEGRAALEADLQAKFSNRGLTTVDGIISRYAPPSENNTAAYIAFVSKALGVGPNDKVNLNDPVVMQKFADAIVKMEGNTKLTSGATSNSPVVPTLSADAKERLKVSPIVGGGQTLQPNPVDVKKAEGSGKEAASFSERVATYKTYVEPAIDETLKFLETTDAGKGTRAFAKYWPGNEQQKLMTLLARVNQMNPGVMPDNISKAIQAGQTGEGFNGKILESLTNEQIRGFLSMAKKNMLNEIDYNNKRSAAEKTTGSGNYAGTQGVTPNPKPASSAKGTVEMTKGGKTYNIPAADAAEAESMGYKRK